MDKDILPQAWDFEEVPDDAWNGQYEIVADEGLCLAGNFPATMEHLATHAGHFPDGVKDTTRLRKRRSQPILKNAQRLVGLVGDPLIFCTILLHDFAGLPLYSKKTINKARRRVLKIIKEAGAGAAVWKLERSRSGVLHLHIIMSGSVDVTGVDDWCEVTDLEGLVRYLAKPADARACKPRRRDLGLDLKLDQMKASEEYLNRKRRGGERFTFHGALGLT
jgi:hypothetical protein